MTPDRTDPTLSTAEYATAGFISAIPQTFVAAPVERAKVLLQVMRLLIILYIHLYYCLDPRPRAFRAEI